MGLVTSNAVGLGLVFGLLANPFGGGFKGCSSFLENKPKFNVGDCFILNSDTDEIKWAGKESSAVYQVKHITKENYLVIYFYPSDMRGVKVTRPIDYDKIFSKVNCETGEKINE